jgi:hypothetical protein
MTILATGPRRYGGRLALFTVGSLLGWLATGFLAQPALVGTASAGCMNLEMRFTDCCGVRQELFAVHQSGSQCQQADFQHFECPGSCPEDFFSEACVRGKCGY